MKEIFIALMSGGFFVFLEFLIKRWDNKHSDLSDIKDSIAKNAESIEAIRKILLSINSDNKTQSDILDAQAEAIMGLGARQNHLSWSRDCKKRDDNAEREG